MKRLLLFVTTFALAFTILGCSADNKETTDNSSTQDQTEEVATEDKNTETSSESSDKAQSESKSSLFSGETFPENEITAAVPVPDFSVAPRSVETSDTVVSVSYEGVSEDEANAYIEQVKNAGFTYFAHESKSNDSYSYSARNTEDMLSEGTSISLDYGKEGVLHIIIS
ncbi:MAG: hypothetical protein IJV62_04370 [Eggerthellaceae bacterium]|nr:hypothetical protein [Eggerthellaceae bacterium]